MARRRGLPDPFKLARESFLFARFLAAFLLHPLRLLFKIGRIIALVGVIRTAIELENPFHHIVEEIAVVRDHQHGAGIFLEMVFEPFDGFSIQMVGRLVQEQDRGFLDQQAGQRNAALLTAR